MDTYFCKLCFSGINFQQNLIAGRHHFFYISLLQKEGEKPCHRIYSREESCKTSSFTSKSRTFYPKKSNFLHVDLLTYYFFLLTFQIPLTTYYFFPVRDCENNPVESLYNLCKVFKQFVNKGNGSCRRNVQNK